MRTLMSLHTRRLVDERQTLSRWFVVLCLNMCLILPASLPANAQAAASCAAPVTGPPSGPAIVSSASTSYGKVLVAGSPGFMGCSLYVLTSDELRILTSGAEPFACSDNPNALNMPCDTVLWPALLTDGAPMAGPGVNPELLGTVTRTDVLSGRSVQQVTYAGLPLYRFFLDETPGETDGATLFDPVTSPAGIWYLVEPSRGRPAPGRASLGLEAAALQGTGSDRTVLAASMDEHFGKSPVNFPVYILSGDPDDPHGSQRGDVDDCTGICAAVPWPPVLTTTLPTAGPGVGQQDLGTILRPDGTHQVTYKGSPLYLFYGDAYIPGLAGVQGINGQGKLTPWGAFDTVTPAENP